VPFLIRIFVDKRWGPFRIGYFSWYAKKTIEHLRKIVFGYEILWFHVNFFMENKNITKRSKEYFI
jgi:hypothetical protein